jgi:DNA polymerase V
MSWRVMETLRMLVGENNVEVYSVDEAFLDLRDFAEQDLQEIALNIRTP